MTIRITNTDQNNALTSYMRADSFFRAKGISGTNLRNLFLGLAVEITRAENKLQEISDEYDLENTINLLDRWESAIGIPDDYISKKTDIDERRNNVILKLVSLGVSTKEGFEHLATLLGFTVTVYAGMDALVFPFVFPIFLVNANARWIMYVEVPAPMTTAIFPYVFPFDFGDDQILILRNLFQALVPTPVIIYFNFV